MRFTVIVTYDDGSSYTRKNCAGVYLTPLRISFTYEDVHGLHDEAKPNNQKIARVEIIKEI